MLINRSRQEEEQHEISYAKRGMGKLPTIWLVATTQKTLKKKKDKKERR
jgi:hypothetical protein